MWAAVRGAWRDPEVALQAATGEVPLDYDRFRVVRVQEDGSEVVVMRGGSGPEARRAYETSRLLSGVVRVEITDNGAVRGVWER
jgi:hypothetical protein